MAGKSRSKIDWWHSAHPITIMFGVGLASGLYGPTLIDLAEIYSSAPDEVAFMNSVRAVGMFVGSCIGGFFYKFMNDQILILISFTIYAAGSVAIPLYPSVMLLNVAGFITGIAFGVGHIGSQVRLVKIWSDQSASAIQAFHTAFGVGAMIGPFIGAPFLSRREGDRIVKETQLIIPYIGIGILYLCTAASMLAAFLRDPVSIEKLKEEDGKMDDESSSKTSTKLLMSLLFVYLLLSINTEATFSTLISVYAVNSPDLTFSKSEAAYLAGIFWSTFTGGRIVSIFVAAFFDLRQLLIFSHSSVLCGSAILIAFNSSELCAWIGSAIMGLGVSSMYGAASGHVFQFFNVRHSHVSVILAASCLGIAVSSYAVPPFVDVWPMFLQYYTGIGNIVHILVLFVMFRATRGRVPMQTKKEIPQGTQDEPCSA